MFVDYYKIAQVHPESEPVVIVKMRKIFASLYHPDKAPESEKPFCHELIEDLEYILVKLKLLEIEHILYYAGITKGDKKDSINKFRRSCEIMKKLKKTRSVT